MNKKLREKAKNDFAKHFLKRVINLSFWKNHGRYQKTSKQSISNNRKKKVVFDIQTKF